ncbi:MAG: response regulator [Limimaricola sp.]|uniref:response regulator n=1 Tax=Limimaricola sp. TaxID=2211665 RepID=UPI001DDFA6AB|nr:response regulator [Limimaricola sp.]MBI1417462.1 response regulator [Limimaricola sp.]
MSDLESVVFVEDDPDIFLLIELALSRLGGFTVKGFQSGAEAVAHAAASKPQLVLLDVMMPDMDGPTTMKELSSQPGFADTPMVFMTAKINPSDVDRLYAMGAAAVLTKPFDPMTLADELRKIWTRVDA